MKKVTITLTPYNALAILAFLKEYFNDDTKDDYKFRAMQEATEDYEESLCSNITKSQLDFAMHENNINQIIGKSPKRE